MKRFISVLLALCMPLALAACGGGTPPAASAPASSAPASEAAPEPTATEPIKIGHICDLTGTEANAGEEAKRCLEFAVDLLGGKIAGREVQIIVGDAQSDSSRATDVARQMVEQDGVVAIFGPTQAGHKAAVAEYMETAGIPLIPYNGTPAALFEGSDWLVGAGGMNPQMPTVMADYAYNDLGYKTASILTMDNMGFRAFSNDFKRVFEALGGTVTQEQYAPFPADDWSPYMAAMQDADAIMAWTTGSNAIALWKEWYTMGVNQRMPMSAFMASAFTDYYIVGAVKASHPEAADAILGTVAPSMYVYNIETPENEAFVKAWTEKFGSVPQTNVAGLCYQAYLLFHTAVEALGGDTTPESLITQIFATDINGPTGRLFFEGSHAATMDVYIVKVIQMEDGSYNYGIVKTYEDVPPAGL